MNFDTLAESIISSLTVVEEGRLKKDYKYSNISVNADKLLSKLHAGDFEPLIKSWSDHSRYGSLTQQQVTDVIDKVGQEIKEMEPASYSELRGAIQAVADEAYRDKGPRRKTFIERLTKAISNLITHKEYDLVSVGTGTPTLEVDDQAEEEGSEMSKLETAIYNFVDQSETPTTAQEIEAQFPASQDTVEAMVSKGLLNKQGDAFVSGDKTSEDQEPDDFENAPVVDIPEIEGEEDDDILGSDDSVASNFKGSRENFDDDDLGFTGGDDYVPSWRRR